MMKSVLFFVVVCIAGIANAATDALDEVNAIRAQHGLPAFQRDAAMTQGAMACADYRASYGMHHHTGNDFAFLPRGSWADFGGCDGGAISSGWLACNTTGNFTYAGAAASYNNGVKFCQLFVGNRPNGPVANAVRAITHPLQTAEARREVGQTPPAVAPETTPQGDQYGSSRGGRERQGLFARWAARRGRR